MSLLCLVNSGWREKLFCGVGRGDMCCSAFTSALNIWPGEDFSPLTSELEKLPGPLVQVQLVYTFHARKSDYVNNIMVTVTLQAAVGHRGSGI